MSPIDARFVRVITSAAKGGEQSLEFQEYRILPGAYRIGKDSPGVMITRLPQPPCPLFGPDDTPPFIQLGGASWLGAGAAGA
jgi:hypothetical protein